MRWLLRLRQKPKLVRDQLALGGAFVLTGVIAFIWLLSVPGQYQSVSLTEVSKETEETTSAFKQFFSSIRAQFAGVQTALEDDSRESDETNGEVANETTATATPNIIIPTLIAPDQPAEPEAKRVLIGTTTASTTDE